MNCPQARLLIDAYADGELDPAGILELEKHLHDCPACALVFRNVQNLKKSLKQDSLFFTAPAELRQKLKAELRPTNRIQAAFLDLELVYRRDHRCRGDLPGTFAVTRHSPALPPVNCSRRRLFPATSAP